VGNVSKAAGQTTLQLKELVSNEMLKAMFPDLLKIASIGLSISVSTASVKRSVSQMKLVKTHLRNSLSDCSLSQPMRIAIESPKVLSDSDLEEVVNVWLRKARRITV
jgi:hypothetical protein